MIALFLLADPLITTLQAAPPREERTCLVELNFFFSTNGEEERQRLLVDPVTDKVTPLDDNGEPIEDQSAEEENEPEDDDEDGGSVSMGSLSYEDALAILDLDVEKTGTDGTTTTFQTKSLPKGTVELSGKDLSKNAAITLSVVEDETGPYIAEYREDLVKPVRMRLVAKVNEYTRQVQFGRPDGELRPVSERMKSAVKVMGNDMAFDVALDYNYLPCPEEGAD
ncbi:MAG: hypothetical protein AAF830_03530 [Pseudomonadota bacterium]